MPSWSSLACCQPREIPTTGTLGRPLVVGLDNSTLSELAHRPDLLDSFMVRVDELRARVVVPVFVIHETAAGLSFERARVRVMTVVAIADRLGKRFVLGATALEIGRIERRRYAFDTPSEPNADEWIRRLRGIDLSILERIQPELQDYLKKERGLKPHRELRERTPDALPDLECRDVERVFSDLKNSKFFWDCPFVGIFAKHGKQIAKWRRNPGRYRASTMLVGYLYIIAMGSMFAGVGFGPWDVILKSPQKGDNADAETVASLAYCDVILAEDERQRARANYLSTQFGLGVQAHSIDQFVALAATSSAA